MRVLFKYALLQFTALSVSATVISTNPPPLQIVTCRKDTDMNALIAEYHFEPKFLFRRVNVFVAPMDDATASRLKADARIRWVEADGKMSVAGQTNSTGLVRMSIDHFPVAHINGNPKPLDVDVAVLDTGITPHDDLNIYRDVRVFGIDGSDAIGHGTSVAGILAASDNGFGVVGVSPGIRLWNIKVLGPPPNDAWENLFVGLDFVAQHADQISVANISIVNTGTNAPVGALQFFIQDAVNAGVVIVAAAGNNGRDLAGPDGIFGTGDDAVPAALPEVMAVSAMDPVSDVFWPSSNFSQVERTNGYPIYTDWGDISGYGTNYVHSPGGAIDVAAPGYLALTTGTNNDYIYETGTSFAAPHVAGLVALYIAANGRATNAEGVYKIRQAIIDASLPQSQWNTNNTHDPDTNPEPLAIASEQWIPHPQLTDTIGTPGNFQLNFNAIPGYDYTLQSALNLNPPTGWSDLATLSGTNFVTPVSIIDTNTAAQNFYRISRNPSL